MSDPYSPYQPPLGYAGYPQQGVYMHHSMPGIVRAAAVVMATMGALILLGSVLIAVVIVSVPMEMLDEAGALEGVPPDMDPQMILNVTAGCFGVCGGLFGLLYLVMSPFVWRGGRGSIIVSAVIAGFTLAVVLVLVVGVLVQGGPQAVLGAMFYFIGAIILGVLLFLLIRSLGALRQREMQAMAVQQMTWQGYYAQQQYPPPQQQPPTPPQQGSGWDPPTQS